MLNNFKKLSLAILSMAFCILVLSQCTTPSTQGNPPSKKSAPLGKGNKLPSTPGNPSTSSANQLPVDRGSKGKQNTPATQGTGQPQQRPGGNNRVSNAEGSDIEERKVSIIERLRSATEKGESVKGLIQSLFDTKVEDLYGPLYTYYKDILDILDESKIHTFNSQQVSYSEYSQKLQERLKNFRMKLSKWHTVTRELVDLYLNVKTVTHQIQTENLLQQLYTSLSEKEIENIERIVEKLEALNAEYYEKDSSISVSLAKNDIAAYVTELTCSEWERNMAEAPRSLLQKVTELSEKIFKLYSKSL